MRTIDELRREAAVPVIIASQQGLVVFVNEAFREAFGWAPEDLVGKPLTTVIPANLRDAHNLGFSRFLATGTATLLNQRLSLTIVTREGYEVSSEHLIIAERRRGEWTFGATIDARPPRGGES